MTKRSWSQAIAALSTVASLASVVPGCDDLQASERAALGGSASDAVVVLSGPASPAPDRDVTYAITDAGTGGADCPTSVVFDYLEQNKDVFRKTIANPPTRTVGGKCVTSVSAPLFFAHSIFGSTHGYEVTLRVTITDKHLVQAVGRKTLEVQALTPVASPTASPTAGATATVTASPTPAPMATSHYRAGLSYAAGTNPVGIDAGAYGVAVAADNGQGHGTVTVRGSDTTGTLSATPSSYQLPNNYLVSDMAGGDLNGDGIRDLAVSGQNVSSGVSILDGTGTVGSPFAGVDQLTFDFKAPRGVAIGDMNNDGRRDLVTASPGASGILVALNSTATIGGPTSFSAPSAFTLDYPNPVVPEGIGIGDIDGDGRLDVVTADPESSHVSLLRGTTNPAATTVTFKAPLTIDSDTARKPQDVAVAYIDGDTKPDLITADSGTGTVTVFTNTSSNGNVSFTKKATPVGSAPFALTTLKADGDGTTDIGVADYGSDDASVLFNADGAGGFTQERLNAAESPEGIAATDLNGDGRDDVVVADNGEPGTNQRVGALSLFLSKAAARAARSLRLVGAAAKKPLALSGAARLTKVRLGAVSAKEGSIIVGASAVRGRAAFKVTSGKAPAGLAALLKADLRGTLTAVQTPGAAFDPIIVSGIVAGRSRADRKVRECFRLGAGALNGFQTQRITLLGATGKAARLRLTVDLAPTSLHAPPSKTGSDQPVIEASRGKKRTFSASCRKLAK